MAVEFRCASWLAQHSGHAGSLIPAINCTPDAPGYVKEDVMEWLTSHKMALVIVDEFVEEWQESQGNSAANSDTKTKSVPPPTFMLPRALRSVFKHPLLLCTPFPHLIPLPFMS